MSAYHAWRVRRSQDRLDDAKHEMKFWHYPSHLRRQQRRIDRAQQRLDRLQRGTDR